MTKKNSTSEVDAAISQISSHITDLEDSLDSESVDDAAILSSENLALLEADAALDDDDRAESWDGAGTATAPPPAGLAAIHGSQLDAQALADQVTLDCSGVSEEEIAQHQVHRSFLLDAVEATGGSQRAWVLQDLALIEGLLQEEEEALKHARDAHRAAPLHRGIARTYHLAALRTKQWEDVVTALAGEAQCSDDADRDLLLLARARVLADNCNDSKAGTEAYRALCSGSQKLAANLGIEAIAIKEGEWKTAAVAAQYAAVAAASSKLSAELSGRSARHFCRAGAFDAAKSAIDKALAAGPLSATTAVCIERSASHANDWSRLIRVREWLLKSPDADAFALHIDIGLLARYRLGDPDLARRSFEQVEELATGAARELALAELAELYEGMADWPLLAQTLGRLAAVSEKPERKAELLTQLGDISVIHLKDPDAAISSYERAVHWVPDCRRALEGAGRLHRQRGDRDALIAMHRAELSNADPSRRQEPARRLGELLVEDSATLKEGTDLLFEVLPDPRHHGSTYRFLEAALHTAERWEELVELYRSEGHTAVGARRAALFERGATVAEEHLGDHATAIALLREIQVVEEPSLPRHLVKLRDLLRSQQDWAGLAKLLQETEDNYPTIIDRPILLAELAEACEKSGDIESASDAYYLACEIAPTGSPVVAAAGRFFLDHGKYADLAALYQAIAERETPAAQAFWLTRAAEVLADYLGQREAALILLHRAVEGGSSRALPTLRRILGVEGRWEELFLISEDGDLEHSAVRRAAIAEAIGETTEALHLYEAALGKGESHLEVTVCRLRVEASRWQSLVEVDEDSWRHYQLLAAEIARDELGNHALAKSLLEKLPAQDSSLAMSLSFWELEVADDPDYRREILERAVAWDIDQPALAYFQYELANLLDSQEQAEASMALRMHLLTEHGWNPVSSAQVEAVLERERRHIALLEVLRLERRNVSPESTATTASRLGALYSQLGMSVEAQHAWQAAAAAVPDSVSISALFGLVSSAERIGDVAAHRNALAEAAKRIPIAWVQALCHWVRGCSYLEAGDEASARDAYLSALEAEPAHRLSLGALAALKEDGQAINLVEALMRAFESSPPAEDMLDIGRCLATALIGEGRLENASQVAERLFAHSSTDEQVCMLLCEIYYRLGNHRRAADLAKGLAERDDLDGAVRSSAALRYVELAASQLSETQEANDWLAAQGDAPESWIELHDLVDIYMHCDSQDKAAEILGRLIATSGGALQTHYLLQQAQIHESLDLHDKALASLAEIQGGSERNEIVERLLKLVEKSDDKALSIRALKNGLASARGFEASVELRGSRWLVSAILEDDESSAEAMPYLERIVALDPEDMAAMEKLAMLAAESDPARAVQFQAALLAKQPQRTELYRSIRKLCVETEDNDGAFLVEAVLMGLGTATEEESYFYRQRRAQMSNKISASQGKPELAGLVPEIDSRLVGILSALENVANLVLPVDWTGYGLDASALPGPGLLEEDFLEVAACLGVTNFRLAAVASDIAPAVEQDSQPILLVPESVAGMSKRHRQCIAGALLSRVAFHGVLGSPSSLCAISPRQLDYLVQGLLSLVRATELPGANAVSRDLHKRLDMAISQKARERLLELTTGLEAEEGSGLAIVEAMNESSARAAVLFARDPAVAVECFKRYPSLIGESPDTTETGLTTARCLAFAVSDQHRTIRNALQLGVTNG